MLARLLAIAIAVAVGGAAGVPSRAPQALRGWADPAAEVTGARALVAARMIPAARAGRSVGARMAPAPVAARPDPENALDTRAGALLVWPGAYSGRDVLARKRARLI